MLDRVKSIPETEDKNRYIRLQANARAIEEIEKIKTEIIHAHLRTLGTLVDMQRGLADQIEEDLLAIDKEEGNHEKAVCLPVLCD